MATLQAPEQGFEDTLLSEMPFYYTLASFLKIISIFQKALPMDAFLLMSHTELYHTSSLLRKALIANLSVKAIFLFSLVFCYNQYPPFLVLYNISTETSISI